MSATERIDDNAIHPRRVKPLVRPPRQTRSQLSLERILDAAEAVIAEVGYERATIGEIVRRGKSSVGVFYARFHDKESLLAKLHERFCERAGKLADDVLDPAKWAGAGCERILFSTVPFLVGVFRENAGLFRAFEMRACQDELFQRGAFQLQGHMSEKLAALLLERKDEIKHPRPREAVDFALRLALDKLGHRTLFREFETAPAMADKTLARELSRAMCGYLGIAITGGQDDPAGDE